MATRLKTVEITETYRVPDFESKVLRGVALLDKKAPGWFEKIDLKALKLIDVDACVVGQLAIKAMLNGPLENYNEGIVKLWPRKTDKAREVEADRHGFYVHDTTTSAVDKMLLAEPAWHPWKGMVTDDVYNDAALSNTLYEFLTSIWVQVIQQRQEAARKAKERRARRVAVKKATTKKTAAKKVTPKKVAK